MNNNSGISNIVVAIANFYAVKNNIESETCDK